MMWKVYEVYLDGKVIDIVTYSHECDAWYVKHTLVNHDGYDPNIQVKRVK